MALSEGMQAAISLALTSIETGGGPFGAVITKGESIVGTGHNQVVSLKDPTAHAEVLAIRAAAQKLGTHELTGCRIYTSCEPCPMCLGAIYWARLEAVSFAALRTDAAAAGFDDQRIYDEIPLAPEARELRFEHEGRQEALVIFDTWRSKLDRVPY